MSITPDVPALRAMSAEHLTEGDVFWGVVHGPENRKGWATLESIGQPVLKIRRWDTSRLDVQVQTPDGLNNLAFDRDDQVLIERRQIDAARTTTAPPQERVMDIYYVAVVTAERHYFRGPMDAEAAQRAAAQLNEQPAVNATVMGVR